MDLRAAMDLVAADTRETTDPGMSYRQALEGVLDELTMQAVEDVVEDPELVDAYRTVLGTDRADVEAALAADDTTAPDPEAEQPTTDTELPAGSADLAACGAGERVDAAVRACDNALQELDDADTAQAEQQHNAELARWDADEHNAGHDAGQDTGLDQEV